MRGRSWGPFVVFLMVLGACQRQPPGVLDAAPATIPDSRTEEEVGSNNRWLTLPFLKADLAAGLVDLEAAIAPRHPDWLELLACSPNSREHESIVVVPAKPRDIHAALLALGLEPGSPLRWRRKGDGTYVVHPARGPKVAIFFVLEQDGPAKEIPANTWVVNQHTGEPLMGNIWHFTGSRFETFNGQEHYLADLNGTVISLVHFGDDLLARPTTMTHETDGMAWNAKPGAIPAAGTRLRVRLRVLRGVRSGH